MLNKNSVQIICNLPIMARGNPLTYSWYYIKIGYRETKWTFSKGNIFKLEKVE